MRTQMRAAVLTLAVGALTAAPTRPQEPASTEREAFARVARVGEAIERSLRCNALRRAADRAATVAEQAAGTFTGADGARDAAVAA